MRSTARVRLEPSISIFEAGWGEFAQQAKIANEAVGSA